VKFSGIIYLCDAWESPRAIETTLARLPRVLTRNFHFAIVEGDGVSEGRGEERINKHDWMLTIDGEPKVHRFKYTEDSARRIVDSVLQESSIYLHVIQKELPGDREF
jgi:hypothetical protein